jgi:hypothetical protein
MHAASKTVLYSVAGPSIERFEVRDKNVATVFPRIPQRLNRRVLYPLTDGRMLIFHLDDIVHQS